jgi:hypothetical protein
MMVFFIAFVFWLFEPQPEREIVRYPDFSWVIVTTTTMPLSDTTVPPETTLPTETIPPETLPPETVPVEQPIEGDTTVPTTVTP